MYTAADGGVYNILCGEKISAGMLTEVVVPNIEQCMDTCDQFNKEISNESRCTGVYYRTGSGNHYTFYWSAGLCVLVSDTSNLDPDGDVTSAIRLGPAT